MDEAAALLSSLRPFREPPPPASILPHLTMLLVGLVLGALVALLVRHYRAARRPIRRAALAALVATRGLEETDRVAAQAMLLRRLAARLGEPTRQQGEAWLHTLDTTFSTRFFSAGEGRAYGEALYRPGPAPEVERLDAALTGLIDRLSR